MFNRYMVLCFTVKSRNVKSKAGEFDTFNFTENRLQRSGFAYEAISRNLRKIPRYIFTPGNVFRGRQPEPRAVPEDSVEHYGRGYPHKSQCHQRSRRQQPGYNQ